MTDGADFDDVKQGGLGNCYFLSVLSAMTERSERIRALFDEQHF
jgi:hypothetical protein